MSMKSSKTDARGAEIVAESDMGEMGEGRSEVRATGAVATGGRGEAARRAQL